MYQKITLIGHLGGDPEMRYMPDGTAVTNFSLATNRSWNDKASGQKVDETTWFRISVWGKQAEASNQYLNKGSLVLVEGRLRADPATGAPRLWTRQDGTVGVNFEITADTVRFISTNRSGADAAPGARDEYDQSPVEDEDDIPF